MAEPLGMCPLYGAAVHPPEVPSGTEDPVCPAPYVPGYRGGGAVHPRVSGTCSLNARSCAPLLGGEGRIWLSFMAAVCTFGGGAAPGPSRAGGTVCLASTVLSDSWYTAPQNPIQLLAGSVCIP